MSGQEGLQTDGEHLMIRQGLLVTDLVLGNVLSLGHNHRLIGQALTSDGAENDQTVVVASGGAVDTLAAAVAAGAIAIVAADLAARLAIAPDPGPVAGNALLLPGHRIHPLKATIVRVELDKGGAKAELIDLPARLEGDELEDALGVRDEGVSGQVQGRSILPGK